MDCRPAGIGTAKSFCSKAGRHWITLEALGLSYHVIKYDTVRTPLYYLFGICYLATTRDEAHAAIQFSISSDMNPTARCPILTGCGNAGVEGAGLAM